jgi:hypothetical protein
MRRTLAGRELPAAYPRRAPRRLQRRWPAPRLFAGVILEWADEFRRLKGRWPHHFDGHIKWAGDDTWGRVNDALARGYRGLPGGSSLAKLLYLRRGVRSPRNVPKLNERQIFIWAKTHYKRTGHWPTLDFGRIEDAPGETWAAIDIALSRGIRGLPGGSSLAQLLDARGVKRNPLNRPHLTVRQILAAADAFFRAHGHWPYLDSGAIAGLPGESWKTVDKALRRGSRGLPKKTTLASLLNKHRSIFSGRSRRLPRLREDKRLRLEQIIEWGNACCKRTGTFPRRDSGLIAGSGELKWSTVDSALKRGSRGLPGGSSLAKLFGTRRSQGNLNSRLD